MTTQYANASYQEVIDLHTESDRVSIVGIHTPCSDTPYHMLKGFWDQFKKFKYNGCSLSLVPAAQLPADPLQVSYDAGEPTIDPRDMLNPIMFHGCHGDDMGAILNALYTEPSSSAGQFITTQMTDSTEHNMAYTQQSGIPVNEVWESLYYRCLTDNTWLKAHPQRGFRKSGLHPMVYSLATTNQMSTISRGTGILPYGVTHDDDTGNVSNGNRGTLGMSTASGNIVGTGTYGRPTLNNDGGSFSVNSAATRFSGFFTPRLQRLGWMDTRTVVGAGATISEDVGTGTISDALTDVYVRANAACNPVLTPKLFMGMLLLPPAYKTEQHFRLILNHNFSFAKFRGASMQYDDFGSVRNAYSYFDYSGVEDSKHIDPEPEPKGEDKNDA